MKLDSSETTLAIMVGENKHWVIETIAYFLFIYEWTKGQWRLTFEKRLPEQFRRISKEFYFVNEVQYELIMATDSKILVYNYNWNTIRTVYKFKEPLNSQPIYFVLNLKQNICMISSFFDIIYLNMQTETEIDVDELYGIDHVRRIIYGAGQFYMLVNKQKNAMGNYLLTIKEDAMDKEPPDTLINQRRALDMGDANLYLITD